MSALPRNGPDDRFCDRIKSMEQQISAKNTMVTDKKPKDLLRAIGKIESNDWNIREIERKIELSKKTEVGKSREKVPKWSKEQFLQRQNKMAKPLEATTEDRFKEIDQTIKNLDKQLKEGTVLERGERGKNKVASIAGALLTNAKKGVADGVEEKSVHKSVRVFFSAFQRRLSDFLFFLTTEFKSWFGLQLPRCVRSLPFLQAKSLSDGKNIG